MEIAPPIGVNPLYIHDSLRFWSVFGAVTRYAKAGLVPKRKWLEELAEKGKRLDNLKNSILERQST